MSALQYNGPASLVPRPRGNEGMVQLTRYPNRGEVKATHRGEALMIIPVVVGDEPFADACRKLRVVFNTRTDYIQHLLHQLTSLGKKGPMTEYAPLTKP